MAKTNILKMLEASFQMPSKRRDSVRRVDRAESEVVAEKAAAVGLTPEERKAAAKERRNARARERYAKDEIYREKQKSKGIKRKRSAEALAKRAAYQRERYANDKTYRAYVDMQHCIRNRNRYAKDEEYRAKRISAVMASRRRRMANDPEFRDCVKARRRERWVNDPEFRDKQIARIRKRRAFIRRHQFIHGEFQAFKKALKEKLESHADRTDADAD